MYLDFDYYKNNGGTIEDEATFNTLNKKAQAFLDSITFKRLVNDTVISDVVKLCLIDLIHNLEVQSTAKDDYLYEGAKVASLSNAGMSITFKNDDNKANSNNNGSNALQNNINLIYILLANEFNQAGQMLLYRGDYR